MSLIVTPPKLYIDTAHLINISRVRGGDTALEKHADAYRSIDKKIRAGHVGVVFNLGAPLDWVDGKATLRSASEIAAVMDDAQLLYIYDGDQFIFLAEILGELRKQYPCYDWPRLHILQIYKPADTFTPAMRLLAKQIPTYFSNQELGQAAHNSELPTEIPTVSIREHVETALRWRDENPETFQERVHGFRQTLMDDIEKTRAGGKPSFVEWTKTFLHLDRIVKHIAPDLDVDSILQNVDITRCPGTALFFDARTKRITAGHEPKDNDVDDWLFLPLAAYCDIMLTDRAHREAIIQGDRSLASVVFADDVAKAVSKLDELLGPVA